MINSPRRSPVLKLLVFGTIASSVAPACGSKSKSDGGETAALSEAAGLAADAEMLTGTSSFTFGTGDSPAAITQTFYLLEIAPNGSLITWSSDKTEVISLAGNKATVVRPAADTEVTLTATLVNGAETTTKTIVLVVKGTTAVGAVPTVKSIYAFGSHTVGGVRKPAYWKDGVATDLVSPYPSSPGTAYAGLKVGSDLYVAGFVQSSMSGSAPGYWKNGDFTELALPSGRVFCTAISIASLSNDLYVQGDCMLPGIIPHTGYWKNSVWTELPGIDATKASNGRSIVLDGNDVYVPGGNMNSSNVMTGGYWKNATWVGLPSLDVTKGTFASSLKIVGTDIYVSGSSTNSSNAKITGYWLNGTWMPLPGLNPGDSCDVVDFVVSGTAVTAVGVCNNNKPVIWENSVATLLELASGATVGLANRILKVDSDVYVSGTLNASPNANAGYWKNGTWSLLDSSSSTAISIQSL
ncbi:MAG: hypothetical protein EOP07_08920 [Proteobacteria bacterium]|nr:MAG: hypothetical protein EOP07_08920 [Pseudomonadota bacterium]